MPNGLMSSCIFTYVLSINVKANLISSALVISAQRVCLKVTLDINTLHNTHVINIFIYQQRIVRLSKYDKVDL